MIEEGKEKELSNTEIILNAITVEEAISTFKQIEIWIGEILHSSEEDFLTLNKQFKTYHKESKNISDNVLYIIQSLTDHKLNQNFQTLNNIVKGFGLLTSEFTNRVENYEIELKKTLNKLENLKIIFQNIRQVLVSIPLLLINTKIKQEEFDFNAVKDILQKADELLQEYISNAQDNLNLLSDIKKDNYAKLQRLNDNIEIGFELFQRKNKEANAFSLELKEKAESNSSYISNIITNLQYHDIIRQKVEHIQRTHQDILNDLEKFLAQPNDNTQLHNKAKTYIKIRDISGLQAAQLIHANNQYHVSIQEIFHGLEEIGNNMIAINSMCENLVGKSGQSKKYYLEVIMENLKGALDYTHNLIILNDQLNKKINQLKNIIQLLERNNVEISYKLNNILSSIIEKTKNHSAAIQLEIDSLKRESNNYVEQINTILKELSNKIQYLYSFISEFIENGNLLQSFADLKLTIPNVLNLLEKAICYNRLPI